MLDQSANTDDALRYAKYFMFDGHYSLILKYDIYSGVKILSELLQYVPDRGNLLQVFHNLQQPVVAVCKATRPSPPSLSETELEEDGVTVNQLPQEVLSVIPVYASHSILHSDAKRRSIGRQKQTKTIKRSSPLSSSQRGDVLCRALTEAG